MNPAVVGIATWAAAVAGAILLTGRLIGWAEARGVVDRPNSRSSHSRVTPRGGGLSIVAMSLIAAVVVGGCDGGAALRLAGLCLPALAVAAVSWLDDVNSLPNRVRFAVHVAAAAAAIAALGPIRSLDLGAFGSLELGPAAWPITLLWIIGMTNAFNFMDGIDGIAGLTAAAAGVGLAAAAWIAGVPAMAAVSLAFAGGAIGFLTWNWPPARIFMGDVGSAFCGFVIAVLPLAAGPTAAPRLVPVAVLAMWPFIFDTVFTIIRRASRGENVFQAHRSHLYQRLVIAGWSHRWTSTLYGLLAAIGASFALVPLLAQMREGPAAAIGLGMAAAEAVCLVCLTLAAERCPHSTPTS